MDGHRKAKGVGLKTHTKQHKGVMGIMDYTSFIKTKEIFDVESGFEIEEAAINTKLFPFQKAIVKWAVQRGRAAIFADCGLGKTPVQLEWAKHVRAHTFGDVLILAPLAVSHQTKREGVKFGIPVNICRTQEDAQPGINITNYEMLKNFDPNQFSGLVLDESSALKNMYGGKFRVAVSEFASSIPYRLACTATPAPNDTMEIVNHSDFLGIMSVKEVLALFFTQDFSSEAHRWRLKGHAAKHFWVWLASWAVALRMPADLGFDNNGFVLPPLSLNQHTIDTNCFESGTLFPVETKSLDEQRQTRRDTLVDRVTKCAELVQTDESQWLIWCDLNIESEMVTKMIPGAVEIRGSHSPEYKEKSILGFSDGTIRVLVTKPSIAGFGINWQCCHNVIFLGLSHSFEKYYQAVRRCWRFGQEHPVNVHLVVADTDGGIIANIQRKEDESTKMYDELISNAGQQSVFKSKRETADYVTTVEHGMKWTAYLGDSVDTVDNVATDSVGLIVYSPPFPGMYVYTNTPRDMGNVSSQNEMIEHYKYLIAPDKMLRILQPGRSCLVHLTQGITFKGVEGYAGIKDFRGAVIQAHIDAGWIYYGEIVIDKDPQVKAIRTKDRGLLFKTLSIDSSHMRMALPDYVLHFKKPGDNASPIPAGMGRYRKKANEGWITNDEWIEWAAPVWYRKSEFYPGGIQETDVLNVTIARENEDERHLCPLQLGVIERCVKLWSAPEETVFSPFMGIGSEGYKAIQLERRFIGCELKKSYFDVAVRNLKAAELVVPQSSIFDTIAAS
jgi:DNA modification methylase/superfamily II DNA or RNA helicase